MKHWTDVRHILIDRTVHAVIGKYKVLRENELIPEDAVTTKKWTECSHWGLRKTLSPSFHEDRPVKRWFWPYYLKWNI